MVTEAKIRRSAGVEAPLDELRILAKKAQLHAYAPYSKFSVGAALRTKNGGLFSACNVENASYGLTICAERNAVFQAVASGQREIVELVIVTGAENPTPPCGACRQVLNEFGPNAEVIAFGKSDRILRMNVSELLPAAFGPNNLP